MSKNGNQNWSNIHYLNISNEIILIISNINGVDNLTLKNTTIRVNEDILEEIKVKAVRDKITQTELINKYLIAGLRNDGVDI